jgi:hypothetical protein
MQALQGALGQYGQVLGQKPFGFVNKQGSPGFVGPLAGSIFSAIGGAS